ncbi:MAG: ImmA/IrrE family metallo-endopeptidase [Phycisphaerales bacterium]|nr:MAG: ImmA/IrrE family metallo-endopeptidase [Phycisphaerales bacterium]
MAKPPAKAERVPWLSDGSIEAEAETLFGLWQKEHGEVSEPPVPVDEMIELQLKLRYEMDDLQKRFGHADVLGAIWFKEQLIRVDRSLDPVEHPRMLGRYRFTLAHEIGHWQLHRKVFLRDETQMSLTAISDAPAFVCRSTDQAREEVQANMFAAFLLMPRDLIRRAWIKWRGTDDVVCVLDRFAPTSSGHVKAQQDAAMQRFSKPFAEQFHVSAEAMSYRLEALGLLTRDRSLFG